MIKFEKHFVSNHELRKFAVIIASVFSGVTAWGYWRNGDFSIWAIILAGTLLMLAVAMPRVLDPIYSLWMNLGHGLGWFNTRLILAIMYFVVLTPIGFFRRAFGKSNLHLNDVLAEKTYAIASKQRAPTHFDWTF